MINQRGVAAGDVDKAYATFVSYCERIGQEPTPLLKWVEDAKVFPGYVQPLEWDGVAGRSNLRGQGYAKRARGNSMRVLPR